jgi:hypothetical protein
MKSTDHRPPLSALTAEQLLARAAEYRMMAATARMIGTMEPLLRVAERYEAMAEAWAEVREGVSGRPLLESIRMSGVSGDVRAELDFIELRGIGECVCGAVP